LRPMFGYRDSTVQPVCASIRMPAVKLILGGVVTQDRDATVQVEGCRIRT
jgi:hypothetical protein